MYICTYKKKFSFHSFLSMASKSIEVIKPHIEINDFHLKADLGSNQYE
jgi:hypothetical protein